MFALWTGRRADTEVDNVVGPACCQVLTVEGVFSPLCALLLVTSVPRTTWVIDLRKFPNHIYFTKQGDSHNGGRDFFQPLLGAQNLRTVELVENKGHLLAL